MSKRTICIIGASRGIGKEVTLQLAADPSNTIIALSRNSERMNESYKGLENIQIAEFDLDSSSVRNDLEVILKDIPKIDVMINVAGYLVNKPFTELTHQDFTRSYQINTIGIMEAVQAVIPKMTSAHILNISSMGGFQGSVKFPGLAAYSTSKAAICSFTELFAEEYKETQIKMNCLCIGAVQTEMLEEAFPGYKAPMGPEKMAEYIVEFALKADQWMNGKIIPVSLSTP